MSLGQFSDTLFMYISGFQSALLVFSRVKVCRALYGALMDIEQILIFKESFSHLNMLLL